MKITLRAELFKLDVAVFKQVVEAFVQQEMKRAVREFFRASLARIPVRTGFLRGSFTDVARAFGANADTSGGGGRTEYYYHSRGSKILKTSRSGIKYVTNPGEVLRRSGDEVVFVLDNKIRYYQANDTTSRVRGAPWESAKEGLAAMTNWLESAADRFPPIDQILTKITITSSGGSSSYSEQPPDVSAIIATRELNIRGFN